MGGKHRDLSQRRWVLWQRAGGSFGLKVTKRTSGFMGGRGLFTANRVVYIGRSPSRLWRCESVRVVHAVRNFSWYSRFWCYSRWRQSACFLRSF